MLNVSRLNPELTGLNKNLWAILVYISIFLVWNQYGNLRTKYVTLLKGIGVVGLIVLVAVFKASTPNEIS